MVQKVIDALEEQYPDARCELNYHTPFQLLVATMLSAQSTDKLVNRVTETLFKKYPCPQDFADAEIQEIEAAIKQIGLFRSKAKNIKQTAQEILLCYNGEVPKKMEELVSLPGVGRKTANVVLSTAFGVDAIAVDTHVLRVSNRLGLAKGENPSKVEEQLMERLPKNRWIKAHHLLIWHGRRVCRAKSPLCAGCSLFALCQFKNKNVP